MSFYYGMQTAYLMVPIAFAGFIWKQNEEYTEKFINIISMLICFLIMCIIVRADIGWIELSQNMIINKWLFYPVTMVGIIFCMGLGKILEKYKYTKYLFAKIGRCSFCIMALHFFAFKIVDFLVCLVCDRRNVLNLFPKSFETLWLVYYVAGIGFPLFVEYLFLKVKENILK